MKTKRLILFVHLIISGSLIFLYGCKDEKVEPIVTPANVPPSCQIISPVNGAAITQGDNVIISVEATDTDGNINKVLFYINEIIVDSINNAPYNYQWNITDYTIGNYKIKAIAEDNELALSSDSIIVTIKENLIIDSIFVSNKQVLLEDFTGHKCVNCPTAALMAQELAEDNDHRLIIYGVHAGYYAEPDATGNYIADFRCETSDEIFNSYVITGWPAGIVNRIEYNGNVVLEAGNWEDAINSELETENVINMKMYNSYNPDENQLTVIVKSSFLQQLDGTFKLVVLIVEDHILSWQKNNDPAVGPVPDWGNYDHRNVLRDAISNTFGSYFTADGTIISGETYETAFDYQLNQNWVVENCNIIAYIIHDQTKEILQVIELGIKTQN